MAGDKMMVQLRTEKTRWFCMAGLLLCAVAAQNAVALTDSLGPDGCNVQALHALGITGQGVSIGLMTQANCLVTHEDFYDKDSSNAATGDSHAHYIDATSDTVYPYEPLAHDTAMAGIAAGRGGKSYPAEIGVAPNAEIYNAKITRVNSASDPNRVISPDYIQTALDALYSAGCRVIATGIQLSSLPANGGSTYSLIYDYYANTYDMIFTNPAGNSASSITVFGDGYNGITVGGVIYTTSGIYRQAGTISNPGPTADGRRKPEIMTPTRNLRVPWSSSTSWSLLNTTYGETSWAGPHAAGVAALLLQYADSTSEAYDGKSVVIKSVMVNSAFPNIRTKAGVETTGQLWHAQRGYGRIDALRAYEVLSQPKVTPAADITQSAGWAYQSISANAKHTYRIYGYRNERLTLTMTWHRAVTKLGSTYADESSPKLNLDLSITDPDGSSVFSEADTVDNLRRADVILPADGFYEVVISNTTNRSGRYYGMAFDLLEPLPGDFNTDAVVDTSDLTLLAENWLTGNCTDRTQDCYGLDTDTSGKIDLTEMADLASGWLDSDPRYYTAQ